MGQSALPATAGRAHCAEPILRARPTGNTGNTKNTGVSTRKRVSHVPWNFRSTWLTVYHRPSIVFPVFIVFIVGLAPTLCFAQCALPANRTHSPVLSKFQNAWHTLHQVPIVRTSPYKSVQVRIPLPAPCALRNVLCQPVGMCIVLWRKPCTWRTGGNLTFPPVSPPFARVLYGGLRHAMRLL